MPGILDPGFGDSSGDPSGSPSDNTTKDTYPVTIIKPANESSETPTKYPYHAPKELKSSNTSNMLIEYTSGYPTGDTRTMSTDKPSPNPRSQTRSEPDYLKRGIQEA